MAMTVIPALWEDRLSPKVPEKPGQYSETHASIKKKKKKKIQEFPLQIGHRNYLPKFKFASLLLMWH